MTDLELHLLATLRQVERVVDDSRNKPLRSLEQLARIQRIIDAAQSAPVMLLDADTFFASVHADIAALKKRKRRP